MLRSPCYPPIKFFTPSSGGFTLIELMAAVSIAAGVISLLVPALLRQVAIAEESNRLTTVEAVVTSDLDKFSNYAKIWKLRSGSYPVSSALTMTSSYTLGGVSIYDPPRDKCNEPSNSSNGLAASLLNDGQSQAQFTIGPESDILNTTDPAFKAIGGNVRRSINAKGNKILISYSLINNSYGLNFNRKALVYVEASAWCDHLP